MVIGRTSWEHGLSDRRPTSRLLFWLFMLSLLGSTSWRIIESNCFQHLSLSLPLVDIIRTKKRVWRVFWVAFLILIMLVNSGHLCTFKRICMSGSKNLYLNMFKVPWLRNRERFSLKGIPLDWGIQNHVFLSMGQERLISSYFVSMAYQILIGIQKLRTLSTIFRWTPGFVAKCNSM